MSFYTACMRRSSLILFWIAVLMLLMGFVAQVMAAMTPTSPYSPSEPMTVSGLLSIIHASLGNAELPFFGSALLWLIDHKFTDKRAEAAE